MVATKTDIVVVFVVESFDVEKRRSGAVFVDREFVFDGQTAVRRDRVVILSDLHLFARRVNREGSAVDGRRSLDGDRTDRVAVQFRFEGSAVVRKIAADARYFADLQLARIRKVSFDGRLIESAVGSRVRHVARDRRVRARSASRDSRARRVFRRSRDVEAFDVRNVAVVC